MTILTGHGKIVCKECGKVISQCRCIDCDKTITESICEECKKLKYSFQGWKPND